MTVPLRLRTPEQAADLLQCKPSWLKEQARLRRIPFTRVGGAYRFSDAHLEQIITIFEERPERERHAAPRRRTAPPAPGTQPLTAKLPRRLQPARNTA